MTSQSTRADDDPRVGDVIRFRWPPRRKALAARRIINIDGERVQTSGMSGRQRDRYMSRGRLAAYVRLERGAS